MEKWRYTKGLHEVGDGVFAYLQPFGELGLSNAGLLTAGEKSVLVDTLIDLPLTREMLDVMSKATKAAESIDVLVNTHANLDHTFGNQLVAGAEIIASATCAQEMAEQNQPALDAFRNWRKLGVRGQMIQRTMGRFNFDDIVITPPTRTFEGKKLSLELGDQVVEIIHVGPAHTKGDVIIYSPRDRVVFTGDVTFIDAHPVIWAGPWTNWIAACEIILALDVDVIVPGHGPITDKAGLREMLHWIIYLRDQTKTRYDAGLSIEDTIRDIEICAPVRKWREADRMVTNVNFLFREFGGRGVLKDFAEMHSLQERLGLIEPASGCADPDHDHGHD